jgi:hypothetical protein
MKKLFLSLLCFTAALHGIDQWSSLQFIPGSASGSKASIVYDATNARKGIAA